MLRIAILLGLIFFLNSFVIANAIYDPLSVPNNKFGIHILETSELSKAAELVNSSGGEWGYVTIPIRANERDVEKWTHFMEEAKKLKIIPILRIASYPVDDHWMAPNEWDLIDFSNFLNELPWPTKNRFVIIYNEPNHKGEWGNFVYPEEYARILDRSTDLFHAKNTDFFVISAGLDASAPNSADSMDNITYLKRMEKYIPGLFHKIDGFSTHAYGNPAFATPPSPNSPVNIKSYLEEEKLLKSFGVENPNLFITEAGWKTDTIGEAAATEWYHVAFQKHWIETNIVAITPFLLSAATGPFSEFSFTFPDGQLEPFAERIREIQKISGRPILENTPPEIKEVSNSVPADKITGSPSSFKFEIYDIINQILSIFSL